MSQQAKEDCNDAGNWLVESNPGDTITHCADVLAFLSHAIAFGNGESELSSVAKQGFFWITRSVEDALRYESERVQYDRKKPVDDGATKGEALQ